MNDTNRTGGPAFPMAMPTSSGTGVVYGMTLRDYFAAKAMQAAVTAWNTRSADCAACIASPLAEEAYEIADAMLEARSA